MVYHVSHPSRCFQSCSEHPFRTWFASRMDFPVHTNASFCYSVLKNNLELSLKVISIQSIFFLFICMNTKGSYHLGLKTELLQNFGSSRMRNAVIKFAEND